MAFSRSFMSRLKSAHVKLVARMSTQRGNSSRTRPQKYKNSHVFKNNMHDTSHKTKFINSIQVVNVCGRCKSIIEWKIKYKKYKPLKAPKNCTKCNQKRVKSAYHTLCSKCASEQKVCPKCGKKEELITDSVPNDELKNDADIMNAIKHLSERKRRTVLRHLEKGTNLCESTEQESIGSYKDAVLAKIKALSLKDGASDEDTWDDESGSENFGDDDDESDC